MAGYALLAKTFSQEAGGLVVWLDEMYVRPAYRSKGLGPSVSPSSSGNLPARPGCGWRWRRTTSAPRRCMPAWATGVSL